MHVLLQKQPGTRGGADGLGTKGNGGGLCGYPVGTSGGALGNGGGGDGLGNTGGGSEGMGDTGIGGAGDGDSGRDIDGLGGVAGG